MKLQSQVLSLKLYKSPTTLECLQDWFLKFSIKPQTEFGVFFGETAACLTAYLSHDVFFRVKAPKGNVNKVKNRFFIRRGSSSPHVHGALDDRKC